MPAKGKVVWSSDPTAQSKPSDAQPTGATQQATGKQVARLVRDRKRRAGKTVTLVEGLVLSPEGYEALASELRRACGTGGTVRGATIEMQGDLRERVAVLLQERGYKVKLVGG